MRPLFIFEKIVLIYPNVTGKPCQWHLQTGLGVPVAIPSSLHENTAGDSWSSDAWEGLRGFCFQSPPRQSQGHTAAHRMPEQIIQSSTACGHFSSGVLRPTTPGTSSLNISESGYMTTSQTQKRLNENTCGYHNSQATLHGIMLVYS